MKRRLLAILMAVCLVVGTVDNSIIAEARGTNGSRFVAMSLDTPEDETVTPAEEEPKSGETDEDPAQEPEIVLVEQTITAECPQGTAFEGDEIVVSGLLPEGAVAEARPVDVEVDGQQALVAYDISVYAGEEQKAQEIKWQPEEDAKVAVEISSPALEEVSSDVEVWSKDGEDAEPEYMTSAPAKDASVVYETGNLSVNAVVETVLKQTIKASDGETYEVSVTYKENSGIPADAELVVSEVGEEEYEAYLRSAAEALGVDVHSITYGRLFDISIVKDGVEYQPDDKVAVTVKLLDADSVGDVKVVHFEDGTKSTELASGAKEVKSTTEGQSVTFETDGFSVFSFLDFSLEERSVTATTGEKNGVLYENDDIILTGRMPSSGIVEATRVDASIDGKQALLAYDIKIYAGESMKAMGITWQPGEESIRVTMKSDALKTENVDVYHMADTESKADLVSRNVSVQSGSVEFDAGSFSVYVVIDHEGGTVVTPRVEFHFIGSDFTGDANPYSASPYNFVNVAGSYQTTQVLKNGELLEMITDPANLVVDNGDGTESEKFFYGWYAVDMNSDSTAYDTATGRYSGTISYSWPENPVQVKFTDSLVIEMAEGAQVGDEFTWTFGNASGTGTIDEDGSVHVYLAPMYQDYYFINFRMGAKEDTSGLINHLLTRKVVVFGGGDTATVRIGNVKCPSPDAQHLIFFGWEDVVDETANPLVRKNFYRTVDLDGNELDSSEGSNGFYISVAKDGNNLQYLNLYPVYAEARWMNFNTGRSGNGASYVGSSYRVTVDEAAAGGSIPSDVGEEFYFDEDFFTGNNGQESHLSRRAGYDFGGWYIFANQDPSTGDITNLTNAETVTVRYMQDGVEYSTTVTTTAIKVVNADGTIALADGYKYQLTAGGETFSLLEVKDGKIFLYKAMDDITLYADWVKDTNTTFRVILWKQKVTDEVNIATEDKQYEYEIFYTSANVSSNATPNLSNFSGSYVDASGNTQTVSNINLLNRSYTGFHYARNDVGTSVPEPDGTSVYNVYYDRDVHRLTFQVDDSLSGYNYTVTTGNTGTQYGLIGEIVVPLTYSNGVWYAPAYGDVYTLDDTNGNYGLVDGQYVELTPVIESTSRDISVFKSVTTLTAGKNYLIASRNTAGNGVVLGRTNDGVNAGDAVTVLSGDQQVLYILADDVNATSIWAVTGSYVLSNGNYRLRNNNGTLTVSTNNSTTWSIDDAGGLSSQGGYWTYHLRYANNAFSLSWNNSSNIHFYEEGTITVTTETVTGYTYDNNGVATTYTGNHRYSKGFGEIGGLEEYYGTRYTRSNATSSWYTVHIIEALYGHNISEHFPIHGSNGTVYNNGQRWKPQTNTVGWNEVMVFVDSMPNGDVVFHLDDNTHDTLTMNYYVQVLPGETADEVRDGVGYKLYNSIGAKYAFITSEDFVDIAGYTKNGSYPTISGNTYLTNYNNTINFYYLRNPSNLIFDVNYPVDISLTYSEGKSSNLTVENILFGESLSAYGSTYDFYNKTTHWYFGAVDAENSADNVLHGPDHHLFGGWYEDASCTKPFDFNSTMPDGNKIVYAKWIPESFRILIDPNGGEIDHVNHTYPENTYGGYANMSTFNRILTYRLDGVTIERPADSGYNRSASTYINANYGTVVREYTVERNYVPISDSVAEGYGGNIYYYINTQYIDTDGSGLPSDCRNALYVLESEIESYYNFYRDWTQGNIDGGYITGTQVLDFNTWKAEYVSRQKYRACTDSEQYAFLGWFKVVDGVMETMPYSFSSPVTESFTLKAMWRLDGGYTIQYIPEYTMPDGAIINGDMDQWTDPAGSGLAYSDGAVTNIYKIPTGLKKNGTSITDDSIIFRGWRLVAVGGTPEHPTYTPLEDDVYYEPSDSYTVNAENADLTGKIYFQVVYEYKDDSERRPNVTNLTLDANTGYVNTSDSTDLPSWNQYPGINGVNSVDHLDSEGHPTQILFGDIQASAAVHLYRYATDAGVIAQNGHNYFTHPDGYFLLGFDDEPAEGDFLATYAADSVIAVERDDDRILYAVWEPMVYVTFVNNTNGTVTFGLTATDADALEVINVKDGMYGRTLLTSLGAITLAAGESITLAFPKGAEKTITISGTNTLGVGKALIWDSAVTLGGTEYNTVDEFDNHAEVTYSHTTDTTHSHVLATGEVNNNKAFSFSEDLIVNKDALVVTFTEHDNEYTLLLDDNYTGGNVQEFDYSSADIAAPNVQVLPGASTRIGYEFAGWAYSPDATEPDFSATKPAGNPWTVTDLTAQTGLFSTGTTVVDGTIVRTLYAVWSVRAEASHVFIYKDVPLPGNRTQEFTFNVAINGSYRRSNNSSTQTISANGTFSLAHGEYAELVSSNNTASGLIQTLVTLYNADGTRKTDGDGTELPVITIRAQAQNTGNNGSFTSMTIVVTEAAAEYYDTTLSRLALANTTNSIQLGSNQDLTTIPLESIEGNSLTWRTTDAGGTAVFTNTRQTYDVAVSKVLHSNTTAIRQFEFTASYDDNGTVTDLGTFYVTSGQTNEDALKEIPAGVTLTITETADDDDNYRTTTKVGSAAATEGKTATFTVDEDTEVTFDNTLVSYPVTFRLVDQDGNTTISGMFSLKSTLGLVSSSLYANANSTNPPAGVFYTSNQFWADTYTLAQTAVPEGYIGLNGDVILKVTGNGIESDSDDVTVIENSDGSYLIEVRNWETKEVTIKKVLVDPLLSSTRQFAFEYSYLPFGRTEAVTGTFNIVPVANDANGSTYVIKVPVNATNLTITELISGTHATIASEYDTAAEGILQTDDTPIADANDADNIFVADTVTDDATITFTNTRKEVVVTIAKRVLGNGGEFSFTATVMNGAMVLAEYGTEEQPVNGFVGGVQNFTLEPGLNETVELEITIPYGAVIKVEEEAVHGYTTMVEGEVAQSYTSPAITEPTTITFENKQTEVAPTGVTFRWTPYLLMLLLGAALVGGLYMLKPRKKEEE